MARTRNADAVTQLAALAHDTRLRVFRLLVVAGPEGRAAGDIADALGVAAATLSHHLGQLSAAGLVVGRQDGRFVRYSARFDTMNALVAFLGDNCCGGNACGPGQRPVVSARGRVKA